MTHPYVLHATAALWSLAAAWPLLQHAGHTVGTAYADDHGYVQAWRPNAGRGTTTLARDTKLATAAITDGPVALYRALEERGRDAITQTRWLLASAGHGRPATWPGLASGINAADPATARDIGRWLWPADDAIRAGLHLPQDHVHIPWNPACPACGVRLLRAHIAAPDPSVWTVVCLAGCRCLGDGCPCGMLVQERGVPHIWLGPPKEA